MRVQAAFVVLLDDVFRASESSEERCASPPRSRSRDPGKACRGRSRPREAACARWRRWRVPQRAPCGSPGTDSYRFVRRRAHSINTLRSVGLPLRLRPLRRLPALLSLPGQTPDQAAQRMAARRCRGQARMAQADSLSIPGTVCKRRSCFAVEAFPNESMRDLLASRGNRAGRPGTVYGLRARASSNVSRLAAT